MCLLACALAGCTNSADPPATPSGEKLTGTVQAFASSAPTPISPSGIEVSIQGTAYQATADTGGHFELDNVPAGVYNIIFSKPGFDSMVYPVHHLIGVGTDIIDDAYLVQESNVSVSISGESAVFTVSITKQVFVWDTTIINDNGKLDTIANGHDSTIITYDTVEDANALILKGSISGNLAPGNIFVYSSLDSALWPTSQSPQSPGITEDAWLATKLTDTAYLPGFESPKIINGVFVDTLARDVGNLKSYSLPGGTPVYIFVVGHSNIAGLPSTSGQYQHFSTTPFGPQAIRFKYIVP